MSLADDFQYQYVEGQMRPDFPALLARFQQASDALAASTPDAQFDQRYGGAEREVYDFFPAQGPVRGHLVYFHAGYWQSRDKALFRWLAGAFTAQGIDVFLVNYPLCPDVALASLTDSARRATRARQNGGCLESSQFHHDVGFGHVGGDVLEDVVLTHLGLTAPHHGLHPHQVDQADEVGLGTDRQLQHERSRAQPADDGVDAEEEVGTGAVELIFHS